MKNQEHDQRNLQLGQRSGRQSHVNSVEASLGEIYNDSLLTIQYRKKIKVRWFTALVRKL